MQTITSAGTSINSTRAPAVYNIRRARDLMAGRLVLDYGAGKYDSGISAGRRIGATVVPYDPYNRTPAENEYALSQYYDVAICSNVLNVINCPDARRDAITEMANHATILLFTVYEGDRSGKGRKTSAGWQENRPTDSYVEEIQKTLGKRYRVRREGKLITALLNPSMFAY